MTPARVTFANPHTLAASFAASATVIGRVLEGSSLGGALSSLRVATPSLRAAAQDLSYNALRQYGCVDVLLDRLLDNPLHDSVLKGLLLSALTELIARPQAAHATVHQAVEAAELLGQARAKGLVNGVLRSFQRRWATLGPDIESTEPGQYRHPQWWIDLLKQCYSAQWPAILQAGNVHPPMTLRVNARRSTVEAYLRKLQDSGIGARPLGGSAVLLDKAMRAEALPGFASGEVSVQDAGAQRAAPMLDARPGMQVLDACAAPGGKTAHLLEICECEVTAVDSSPERIPRIEQNLARLGLSARVMDGDALSPDRFSEGRRFDRILLDAPCSASGVVRRHPDMKWLRRASDLERFAATQAGMLDALWRVLAAGGKLLYATCSIFPKENQLQIGAFLERHPDAEQEQLDGIGDGQILPGATTDGFYYALLRKR